MRSIPGAALQQDYRRVIVDLWRLCMVGSPPHTHTETPPSLTPKNIKLNHFKGEMKVFCKTRSLKLSNLLSSSVEDLIRKSFFSADV